MKIAFSGSRDLWSPVNNHLVHRLAKQFYKELPQSWGATSEHTEWEGITEVLHGDGRGFDQCVEAWARLVGLKTRKFPADWKKYGKKAGPMRNKAMIAEADGLIAVPHGPSPGTRGTIGMARFKMIPILVYEVAMIQGGVAV